jgi:HPt (histidine-containing phosphotransfer) domain-containing protein
MDYKDLAEKLGIDEEDFVELVDLFVTTTRSDIAKIRTAVQTDSPADAAAAAHSTKGAAGNLGFDDIFALSQRMEMQAKQGNLDQMTAHVSDLEAMLNAL